MKVKQFSFAASKAVLIDPQFDRNFTSGVYLDADGKYKTASPYHFQNPINGFGGDLRDKFYFIVHGENILEGRKKFEEVVLELNEQKQEGIINPVEYIAKKVQGVEIYASHEESIEKMAPKMIQRAKDITNLLNKM